MEVDMNKRDKRIDIHADDFALSMNVSREVIRYIQNGELDSISVIPNMSCFDSAVGLLKEQVSERKMPKYSVHLNMMEGHCLSNPREVPDLVDERGYFKVSWGSLVIDSFRYGHHRNSIREQLKKEIRLQIERVRDSLYPEKMLRIDSHQHTHMIPVVFDALVDAIQEGRYPIEYIRIPEEPQWPFIQTVSLWTSYSPINIIKNVVLNVFSKRNRRVIRSMGLPYDLLWGLVFSGHMDSRRVAKLWPAMMRYIEKRDRTLEILFHPGRALPEEIGEEYVKEGFVRFHLSEERDIEKEAVSWVAKRGEKVNR